MIIFLLIAVVCLVLWLIFSADRKRVREEILEELKREEIEVSNELKKRVESLIGKQDWRG